MATSSSRGFGSSCVHAGFEKEQHRAHLTPIYASSTYLFDSAEQAADLFLEKEKGYVYSRFGNPTITQAEQKMAALETYGLSDEHGQPLQVRAILHASGMAAISTLMLTLAQSGQQIFTHHSLYGGTQELSDKVLPSFGISTLFNAMKNMDEVEAILQREKNIALMYLETPANPTLQCVDLQRLIALAHQYHIPVAVDNTFATPYLQQPFAFGADYVLHSTTKFLNGHGTALGGVILGRDLDHMNTRMTKYHRLLGGSANAFDAFLLSNGIKTLELRMQRHVENAVRLADFLSQHPQVIQVNYPGLPSHPDHAVCMKQMKAGGAVMSFEVKGGYEAGKQLINRLQLCSHAVSLGTCETLLTHPASTTHIGVAPEQRRRSGITDGLIRMSVGIENEADLIQDLDQALR